MKKQRKDSAELYKKGERLELLKAEEDEIKIIDLVKALDKNIKYHIVGIRPGEKLHEVLCHGETARDTLEFKDYSMVWR